MLAGCLTQYSESYIENNLARVEVLDGNPRGEWVILDDTQVEPDLNPRCLSLSPAYLGLAHLSYDQRYALVQTTKQKLGLQDVNIQRRVKQDDRTEMYWELSDCIVRTSLTFHSSHSTHLRSPVLLISPR